MRLPSRGQGENNISSKYIGHKAKLTEKGKLQAKLIAHRLKKEKAPVDIILSSRYDRAMETSKIMQKVLGCKLQFTELLNEKKQASVYIGREEGDPKLKKIDKLRNKHYFERGWKHSDEETIYEMMDRAAKCISYIEKLGKRHVLVVSHGIFIRGLITSLMVQRSPHYKEWVQDVGEEALMRVMVHSGHFMILENSGITVCVKEPKSVFVKKPMWRLETLNDFTHL